MDNFNINIYKDIQARTAGEIYLGVVGPVRTGKSTFIKRFIDLLVLPNMTDEHNKARTKDELPQSAAGRTIMTTEPKFIPKEAAHIALGDDIDVKVRLVDCVGYMVEGATGHIENNEERMVKTPWFDYDIPFTQAAEIGTRKVIHDHSTIGLVVTCDGSFGDIDRANYIEAERRCIDELRKLNKPYIVLLNSVRPYSDETIMLARQMMTDYGVNVMPINCEQLKPDDIMNILEQVLKEFPVTRLDFHMPKWVEILPGSHWLKSKAIESMCTILSKINFVKDVTKETMQTDNECLKDMQIRHINMSNGSVQVNVEMQPEYYYKTLSETTGVPIESEYQLMKTIKELASMKAEYDKVQTALESVNYKGYGVVTPLRNEITLSDPEVVKHGNKFGVKMHAHAPSINMIKANIETEIAPIVGSEQQANDLIDYIIETSRDSEGGIWSTNIFGKSIEQIVDDGIQAKISQVTDECQMKLQDAMQKVINDSNGGMICIII